MSHWDKIQHKLQPRENQKIAVDNAVTALLDRGFHGLFLEMSLGKTKCAFDIAEIMKTYGKLDRLLVVAPKAICSVWGEELEKQSNLDIEPVIWENKPNRSTAAQLRNLLTCEFGMLIVRLELFQRKNEVLKTYLAEMFDRPTLVALDESSKIKNATTQRTPRLIDYTKDASYKIALTGSPWGESPLDVFTQLEFMQTGFWFTYKGEWSPHVLKKHWYIFRNRYQITKEIRTGEGRIIKVPVGTRRVEEIARKIQGHVTQQKKDDWLDLPPKMFQTLTVEMDSAEAKAYKQMKEQLLLEYGDTLLTASNAVTLLTRLRQIAGGFYPETGEPISKKPTGIEMLMEDVSEYSGKVVIAASYIAEIEGLVKVLSKEYGADQVCTYYGATKNRDEQLARFESEARFMVLNPQSGAYGLNLQHASLMYLYSRPFSYEQNAQLLDRIHRPGQKNSCVYKDIVHVGTVQEQVIKAFQKKKDVVDKFDELTLRDFLS